MKKKLLLLSLTTITSISLLSAQSTNPSPYCDASFDDAGGFMVDDHINTVTFGTINNNSNLQFNAPHYVFYNNLSIGNFISGNSYNLSLNMTTAGGCGYGVWIDFNHNNTFETSEKVAGTTNNTLNVGGIAIVNQSVLIPANATLGNTRMRVRIVEDDLFSQGTNFSTLPCNLSTSAADVMDWGETEDYTINITTAVGLNEVNKVANSILVANPVTTTLNVTHDLVYNITYKIASIAGQEMQTGIINNAEKQINVASLSDGIYFLQLFDNNKSIGQQKFIKSVK